jgi:hypothetical protein
MQALCDEVDALADALARDEPGGHELWNAIHAGFTRGLLVGASPRGSSILDVLEEYGPDPERDRVVAHWATVMSETTGVDHAEDLPRKHTEVATWGVGALDPFGDPHPGASEPAPAATPAADDRHAIAIDPPR